jgi:hypothetical protein
VVDALNLIAEVMDLEATLSICLHLVRASFYEALDHLCSGGRVVNRPRILRVVHSRCSSDSTNEVEGHMDLLLSDPGIEGIANHPVQVGVELTD